MDPITIIIIAGLTIWGLSRIFWPSKTRLEILEEQLKKQLPAETATMVEKPKVVEKPKRKYVRKPKATETTKTKSTRKTTKSVD